MQLIRIARGKREVIATGDRKKLQNIMRQHRESTRCGACTRSGNKYKVEYKIEEE